MLAFANKYKRNDFSQFGEDGILEEIIKRLGLTTGSAVEFGAHNGVFCSNSRNLILKGWKGLLIEGDMDLYQKMITQYSRPSDIAFDRPSAPIYAVTMLHRMVTVENVNQIVPRETDLLSVDVDGIDYNLWEAWTGKAKIVVVEINSSLPPLSWVAGHPKDGSSYLAMWTLAVRKGYFLVCHTGNMIFVHKDYADLFPEIPKGDAPIARVTEFFDTSFQNA